MVNVIIPIIDNVEVYSKTLAALSVKLDVNIVVGVTENLASDLSLPKQVMLQVFKNGSKKEEIINALQSFVQEGKIVVARRPFSLKEFDKLKNSQSQITYCKSKKLGKFKSFMQNISHGLIKILFGVKFFEGDASLIAFDEELAQVLISVPNLSYCSRVDRWRGASQETIESESPSVKMEYDKKQNIKLIIFSILSIILPAIVTTVVAIFARGHFIVSILLFCLCFLGVTIGMMFLCSLAFNLTVGSKNFDKAKEI